MKENQEKIFFCAGTSLKDVKVSSNLIFSILLIYL